MPGIAHRTEVVELRVVAQRRAQRVEPGPEVVGAEVVEPGRPRRAASSSASGSNAGHRLATSTTRAPARAALVVVVERRRDLVHR